VIQQGQVFKLKATCADGDPLWAYRYRVAGRGSARLQVGGFSTRAEAQRALQNKMARLLPGGRSATMTLGEWVEEYRPPRWVSASRRALAGAGLRVAAHGSRRALVRSDGGAAAGAEPGGRRKLIEENPAKRVPNPVRRCRKQRPFDSWAQLRSVAGRLGPMFGPMVVFAAANRASTLRVVRARTRRRGSRGRCRPDPTGACEWTREADQDAAEQTCGSAAGDRARGARTASAAGRQLAAFPEYTRRPSRLPQLQPPPLEARPESSWDRAAARPLRPAPHLYLGHLRAPGRRPGVRPLTLHGYEHRDDRPPLRPSRGRQPRARRLASRRARARTGRGRWADVGPQARNAAQRHGFQTSREPFAAVDVKAPSARYRR